mmetsp:Transcript_4013/g.10141  ORF Transcript_4013/g.10141 Transcript_4013/m.10141 type:complete len:420 (+) Transcript_4013:306-1565(+)
MDDTEDALLGLPGPLVSAADGADYTATKAGGLPLLPPGVKNALRADGRCCPVCATPLSLIFQAYAPLTAAAAGREIAERAVYVFACAKEGCGVQPECWRAVRAQSPAPRQCQQPAISARKASVLNASQAEEDSKGGIDWGLNQINTWGSAVGWGASQHGCMGEPGLEEGNTGDQLSSGGAFDFNDLDSALDGLVVQTTASIGPSQPQNQAIVSEAGKQAQGGGGTASNKLQCVVGLPEFHIFAELEPGKDGKSMSNGERQHTEQLLAEYEGGSMQMCDADPGTAQAETWAGEAYEEDHTDQIDSVAMKFLKRLARAPSQCARYSYAGCAMWPAASQPKPPPCALCGAARQFEVQLMPPLVHYLEEAAAWTQDDDTYDTGQMVHPPTSWAWATVAVYTCSGNCETVDGSPAEEWIALVNE